MIPSRTASPEYSENARSCDGNATSRTGEPAIRQVAENAQVNTAAGDRFDPWCQPLAGRVDGVGAHRVAHIVDEVHDQKGTDWGVFDYAHLQITRAAADTSRTGSIASASAKSSVSMCKQRGAGALKVLQIKKLHLADHLRRSADLP